jgi:hypothetical protein
MYDVKKLADALPRHTFIVDDDHALEGGTTRASVAAQNILDKIFALPTRFCDNCQAELKFVFGNRSETYENALHVVFEGGYGEYVDIHGGVAEAIFCENCAKTLLDGLNPNIHRIIDNAGD